MTSKRLIYESDGEVSLIDYNSQVVEAVKPGFYKVRQGGFLSPPRLKTDPSVKIPDFEIAHPDILSKIEEYFSETAIKISKSIGFIHKMGILLHGKFGCGKTTLCYQVAKIFIDRFNTICITATDIQELEFTIEFVKALRQQLSFESTVIIIVDECETMMDVYESRMKSILDSTNSLDNCLIMFTTNYIDEIPEAIKDRPSRIKECIELKGEDDEIRIYKIFKNLNEKLEEDMRVPEDIYKNIVSKHIDSTIDEIKHAFLNLAIKNNKSIPFSSLIKA